MTELQKNILKRNDPYYVLSKINHDINNISTTDKQSSKTQIKELFDFIVVDKPQLSADVIQDILINHNKALLKLALFHNTEYCREHSIKILIL